MALNSYFNNYGYTPTQNVTEDLVIEAIKIYGVETYYLPRTAVNNDFIMGSDDLARFESAVPIEMYVKNVEGYAGQGEFLSSFGLQIKDTVTFNVAHRRFEEEATTANLESLTPREGDLIWFPLAKSLFEITFTENEEVFFQVGRLMMYTLSCEKFTYSDEDINTGIEEIDAVEFTESIHIPVLMASSGTGNFTLGETVTGSINGFTAEVAGWDNTTRYLKIINFNGEFLNAENLVGDNSGAIYTIEDVNYLDLTNDNTPEQNREIQDISDSIFDFSENDPFSEGLF